LHVATPHLCCSAYTPFVPDDFQDLSTKEKDELFAGIAAASKDEFDQAMKTQSTNDAWSSLAKMGEKNTRSFEKFQNPPVWTK
jgi:hypothetical protein